MVGQLGHVMVGLADSIMIGQLGTVPLAASAFANSIFIIPMVFGLGMAFGLTTPIANSDGEGRPEKAGTYLRHGLLINIIVATLIFLLVVLFSQFTYLLGQEALVEELSHPYLLIISSSIFPFMIFLTYKQFAEGLSFTRMAMVISIGANLINILLNYILIFGHWGFPELGLEGAGYATLISRLLMALFMFLYVTKSKTFSKYLKHLAKTAWDRSYFKDILKVGIPSGSQYLFEVSAFALAAVFAGQISAEALAAHQIAISLAALSYMMASGLGAAATVRVANQLGQKKPYTMRKAGRVCLGLTLVFMTACGLMFFLGRDFFPGLYTSDTEVAATAAQLLIIAVIFQLSDGTQVVALGALRGLSEVKVPTLIALVAYWGFGLVPAYLMGITYGLGPLGIWYGLAIGLTVAAILLYWRFEWKSKKLIHAIEH